MSQTIQWAPDGALSGVPSEVARLLAADDGRTFGYGYGPGWSIIFRHEHGEVSLLAGQWLTKNDDGTFTVTGHDPRAYPGCQKWPHLAVDCRGDDMDADHDPAAPQ